MKLTMLTMNFNSIYQGILLLTVLPFLGCGQRNGTIGKTEITKWADGKKAAISITYDDGSINQFKKALPIMDRLGLPGTFFILTGQIPGAEYPGRFLGRPIAEIIGETAVSATNDSNFFERAAAIAFSGYKGGLAYHTKAGGLYEGGKVTEAKQLIDEAYSRIRKGELPRGKDLSNEALEAVGTTWDDLRQYAKQGHEFGAHTITHPYLAILDEPNMLYELEKSKADILTHLGAYHTFSAEGPYGTEDPRVVEHINRIYPATRNRMPAPYLEELNRSSKQSPRFHADKEYVQWQRGAYTKTPMSTMEAWVDTAVAQGNTWLVLVFHGIDDIGWEAVDSERLGSYFQYIKSQDEDVWVATFGNVVRYMRQRMNAKVKTKVGDNKVSVQLTHQLDTMMYNTPLTLKTYLPAKWDKVEIRQGGSGQIIKTEHDTLGVFVKYEAYPNRHTIEINKA